MLFVVLEVVEPDMMLVLMVLIAKFKQKEKKKEEIQHCWRKSGDFSIGIVDTLVSVKEIHDGENDM